MFARFLCLLLICSAAFAEDHEDEMEHEQLNPDLSNLDNIDLSQLEGLNLPSDLQQALNEGQLGNIQGLQGFQGDLGQNIQQIGFGPQAYGQASFESAQAYGADQILGQPQFGPSIQGPAQFGAEQAFAAPAPYGQSFGGIQGPLPYQAQQIGGFSGLDAYSGFSGFEQAGFGGIQSSGCGGSFAPQSACGFAAPMIASPCCAPPAPILPPPAPICPCQPRCHGRRCCKCSRPKRIRRPRCHCPRPRLLCKIRSCQRESLPCGCGSSQNFLADPSMAFGY